MILGFISPFLDMVILLGALQGFIFSALLFSTAKRHPANRFLAWLLILASVASLKLFAVQKGWFDLPGMPLVDALVPLIIVMPIGPLIYFYVRTSLHPDFRFSRKDRVHFYPVVIDLLPQLTAIVFLLLVITQMIKNNPGPWGRFIDVCNVYSDIPRWISITIYVWLAAKTMEHQGAVTFGPVNNPVLSDQADLPELIRTTWHESAHEWWGNSITCKDMADLWIHEAFATYAEVMAYETFGGKAAGRKYLKEQKPGNDRPIIGTYDVNDFHLGDMYSKGCLMLNTLRHCIGNDSLWFALLRGLQNRFRYQSVTSEDIVGYIDSFTKTNYTPFFDQYLRHDSIPKLQLITERRGDTLVLSYRWKTDVDHFDMPVETYTAKGLRTRLTPTGQWQTISLPRWTAADLKIDTDDYFLDVERK